MSFLHLQQKSVPSSRPEEGSEFPGSHLGVRFVLMKHHLHCELRQHLRADDPAEKQATCLNLSCPSLTAAGKPETSSAHRPLKRIQPANTKGQRWQAWRMRAALSRSSESTCKTKKDVPPFLCVNSTGCWDTVKANRREKRRRTLVASMVFKQVKMWWSSEEPNWRWARYWAQRAANTCWLEFCREDKRRGNTGLWRQGLKCEGLKRDRRRTHLVGLSHGAVVEAEEVDDLIQKLADADAGDVHGAAQSLSGINQSISQTYLIDPFGGVPSGKLA